MLSTNVTQFTITSFKLRYWPFEGCVFWTGDNFVYLKVKNYLAYMTTVHSILCCWGTILISLWHFLLFNVYRKNPSTIRETTRILPVYKHTCHSQTRYISHTNTFSVQCSYPWHVEKSPSFGHCANHPFKSIQFNVNIYYEDINNILWS